MTAAILSTIQRDAFAWQLKNFGEPNALLMLVGMGEEYGESQEHAADTTLYLDDVGDCCVYLMQFCSCRDWDIGELWERRDLYELPARAWPVLSGKINHHYAKALTRYRGPASEHDDRCRAAISALLRHWDLHLADMGQDFIATVQKTWDVVARRDWTKDRPAPAESVETTERHDPWVILKEARLWIAEWSGASVGADEMIDRIVEVEQSRPASGAELAEKYGFEPHTPVGKLPV